MMQLKAIISHYKLRKKTAANKLLEIISDYRRSQEQVSCENKKKLEIIEFKLNDELTQKENDCSSEIKLATNKPLNKNEIGEVDNLFAEYMCSMQEIINIKDKQKEKEIAKSSEKNVKRKIESSKSEPVKKRRKVEPVQTSSEIVSAVKKRSSLKPIPRPIQSSRATVGDNFLDNILSKMTESLDETFPQVKWTNVLLQHSPTISSSISSPEKKYDSDENWDENACGPIQRYIITDRPMTPPNVIYEMEK